MQYWSMCDVMKKMPLKLFSLVIATAILLSPVMVLADDSCHCPDCARERASDRGNSCCAAEESCCCCQGAKVLVEGSNGGVDPLIDYSNSDDEKESGSKGHDCQCCMSIYFNCSAIMPVGDAGRVALSDGLYQHIPVSFTHSGWVYQILHPPR